MKHRFIVVANRLPVRRTARGIERSPGGLVSALDPLLQERESMWIGWDGAMSWHGRSMDADGLRFKPIGLTAREVELFYHGFCNRTIWPLYHDAIRPVEFSPAWWEGYERVNKRFARSASRLASRRGTVWVHDFQLQRVPALLRESRSDVRIGFFLHIPFPPEETFARLPWRREIIEGLLGADVVGFQTWRDAQNFSRSARHLLDADGTDSRVMWNGREIRVNSFPISIDVKEMESLGRSAAVKRRAEEIRSRLGERRIMLCVDRLDYTKGIENRLLAFETLLQNGWAKVEDTVMVQVAVPSREGLPEYEKTRAEIEGTVGRINGEFSQPGMVAVHYFRRNLGREELAAYYLAADVMLVTPLNDGMNLVAKEFVASRVDGGGVLVLSEFAGASKELRQALLVNPYDVEGMAETFRDALSLQRADARFRMGILRSVVRRHDVLEWGTSFLDALEAA
jgi:alpha,alpha-trehalose-phosphate synthase [UDP-forming]